MHRFSFGTPSEIRHVGSHKVHFDELDAAFSGPPPCEFTIVILGVLFFIFLQRFWVKHTIRPIAPGVRRFRMPTQIRKTRVEILRKLFQKYREKPQPRFSRPHPPTNRVAFVVGKLFPRRSEIPAGIEVFGEVLVVIIVLAHGMCDDCTMGLAKQGRPHDKYECDELDMPVIKGLSYHSPVC